MSTAISAQDVKALRERTGAGIMDAKSALQESGGDIDKAIEILRVKGQASAAKRGGRTAAEGVVSSYIHAGGKIGVLVEIDCETDFVARSDEFKDFAREVAIHIAGTPTPPLVVSAEEIPEEAGFSPDEPATPSGTRPEAASGAGAPRERRTFDPDDDS